MLAACAAPQQSNRKNTSAANVTQFLHRRHRSDLPCDMLSIRRSITVVVDKVTSPTRLGLVASSTTTSDTYLSNDPKED